MSDWQQVGTVEILRGRVAMHNGDNPAGLQVQFPSTVFGAEQLADLMAEPVCQPGPSQRLRFVLDDAAAEVES